MSRTWGGVLKGRDAFSAVIVLGAFVAGMVFWGGFNWALEATNTQSFCISCHVMEKYPYAEYKSSVHFSNRSGVRATCPDCHVPKEWLPKVVRKIRATNEVYHWIMGSIDSPTDFEAKRLSLARQVWTSMEASDSLECRNCHAQDHMVTRQRSNGARTMHELGIKWKMTCIDCHKGISHRLPQGFDAEAEMDALHARMEQEKIDCRECHEDMAGPPPGDGWD